MSAAHIAAAFDRIGGHVNAFTSKEYTCFYAKVMSRHAKEAARILSDMFFHSSFKDEEIERERQVILEEIRMVEDMPMTSCMTIWTALHLGRRLLVFRY